MRDRLTPPTADEVQAGRDRDIADQRRIDALTCALEEFAACPPRRCRLSTLEALSKALTALRKDSDQIDRAWN